MRALLNHDPNEVLGRTKSGTLRLFDEERGLRFELDLPDSPLGENVREAVRRGDLDGASFRFEVGQDDWAGEVRTIQTVKALRDVTLATYPAYPAASIELRTKPEPKEEPKMEEAVEKHEEEEVRSNGNLRVEDRASDERRTLLAEFRQAGWAPGSRAEIPFPAFENAAESRALTWTGSVDNVEMLHRGAGAFGADQRYAWPAFPRVAVDGGVTSVQVLTQTARSLPTAANVVRAIDAVTDKPEAGSTLTLVAVAMKQVAAVQSGIPNVMLEQDQIESVIGQDLRLSINEGLDKLILDAIALSGFQAPSTDPLLVSIRKAMTTIYASGYNPDLLILTRRTLRHSTSCRRRARRRCGCSAPAASPLASCSAWTSACRRRSPPPQLWTRRRLAACTPPRSRSPRSRRTPARRTQPWCEWKGTQRSGRSGRQQRSGSRPRNGQATEEEVRRVVAGGAAAQAGRLPRLHAREGR